MDTRKVANGIGARIAESGIAQVPDVWVPYFDCEPVCVVGDDPWPVGVVVTRFDENERGERKYIGTRIYQPPKEA